MMVEESIRDYINSLESSYGSLCDIIEREALECFVPIIKPETAAFLRTMVTSCKPSSILEVGAAIGYSSILMSQVMPKDCKIVTIENYEKRIPIARRNFERAGITDRVELIAGDAKEVLERLEGPFPFIFMDAAKGQYIHWLPHMIRLLEPGGLLISDNVLQDGDIAKSRFAVERRNRTIHSRMREYLYQLKHTKELSTSILPLGDGVTVSVRL